MARLITLCKFLVMRHAPSLLVCATFFSVLSSCDSKPDRMFTRMSGKETGVTFINGNDETESFNILAYEYFYNGGGVATGDINNDGLTDIYFTSNAGENKLYLNEGNFRFRDISANSGTTAAKGWKTGVSMADVNADGFLDIYVCRSAPKAIHERTNYLFINNGDLTFTESASRYGLDNASYSTQSAFFDYDRDGDLDMFLLNHSFLQISNSFDITQKNTKKRFPFVGNQLFRNDGTRFTDVSDTLGIYGPASNYGLGVSLADINNDGWIDLYTGCDYTGRDRLLINRNGQFFSDVTDSLLTQISKFSMGTDIADINNDGWMDIFSLDMLPEDNYRQKQLMGADRYDQYINMARNGLHYQSMRNMLHLNNGGGRFSEIAQLAGIASTDWSWSCLFADFDNDGAQDLFITNGFKRDLTNNDFTKFDAFEEIITARKQGKKVRMLDVISKFPENRIPNYMFRGGDGLEFSKVTKEWGLDEASLSNGAAYADLDNDGDLDLIVNNVNGEAGLYRNNAESLATGNFLQVALAGMKGNPFGTGAKVTVYCGGHHWTREQLPVRGFQSSVDPVLHFGVGREASVDSVVIRWPDNNVQRVMMPGINKRVRIEWKPTHNAPAMVEPVLFKKASLPFVHTHIENDFLDFSVQPLLPRLYSREGPAFAAGDVNGDSIVDYYFGGAKGHAGKLYVSSGNGTYRNTNAPVFESDRESEDVDAVFLDVDNDGDRDLYVVSGGYEFEINAPALADRLYMNNGKGNFTRGKIPEERVSGSCVAVADYNGDGFVDVFVGGRVVPGRFPERPASTLLKNDGRGNLVTDESWTGAKPGMITDAVWFDVNNDRYPDLLVVGEWMGPMLFRNINGQLTDDTGSYFEPAIGGLWNSLLLHDFDGDGDQDFVAGNYGENSLFRVSADEPMSMLAADFDDNGSVDPVVTYFIQGKSYPYPTRDELVEQLPSFRKRFTDYNSYSVATIDQVLKPEETLRAVKAEVQVLGTSYFQFDNGRFVRREMPAAAQLGPMTSLALIDVNRDGVQDVVCGGNISENRARIGRLNSSPVVVLVSDAKGNFRSVPAVNTGITVFPDVKKVYANDGRVIFIPGEGSPQVYELAANPDLAFVKAGVPVSDQADKMR